MDLDTLKKCINLSNDKWENVLSTNCYAYALGLDIPQDEITRCAYELGAMYYFYSKEKRKFRLHEELLKLDLDILSLTYREVSLDEPLKDGEWKIAYFDSIYECGYHFFREIENGVWWHKYDWGYSPTCLDDANNIITDPTKANINYRGLELKKCYLLKRK